jgi:hypothetical protein
MASVAIATGRIIGTVQNLPGNMKLSVLATIKCCLPVQLTYQHVKGHQRKKSSGQPLDSWTLLIDNMDTI